MKIRLRIVLSAIVWSTIIGIPWAQTGIPNGTQQNPGRVFAGNGNLTVIGCVSRQGESASAVFIISDPRPKPPARYRLEGDPDLLRLHLGHTVEVTGAAEFGGRGATGAATPKLKVQSLIYISTTCSQQK